MAALSLKLLDFKLNVVLIKLVTDPSYVLFFFYQAK